MKAVPEVWRRAGWNWKLAAALVALAAGTAGAWLEPSAAAGAAVRYGTALLHGVGLAGGILLMIAWIQPGLDELDLRVRLEAYRFGFLGSFFVLFVYGELVEAGLPARPGLSRVALYMLFLFAVGFAVVRYRYR